MKVASRLVLQSTEVMPVIQKLTLLSENLKSCVYIFHPAHMRDAG